MASAAIAFVGTVLSIRSQKKAQRGQQKASEIQGKRAEFENARARRQQVAQARRARAATIAQGEAAGISGGSQVAGAAGSIQTQAASNISFLNQLQGLDEARFGALQAGAASAGRAATFQAVGNFAQTGAGVEGLNKLQSFLKPKQTS